MRNRRSQEPYLRHDLSSDSTKKRQQRGGAHDPTAAQVRRRHNPSLVEFALPPQKKIYHPLGPTQALRRRQGSNPESPGSTERWRLSKPRSGSSVSKRQPWVLGGIPQGLSTAGTGQGSLWTPLTLERGQEPFGSSLGCAGGAKARGCAASQPLQTASGQEPRACCFSCPCLSPYPVSRCLAC